MEQVDVLVIGAGPGGITTAKGYHQCDPQAKILLLDANQTLGGTWAMEHLYPGLRTNNLFGCFEMPDLPFEKSWGAKEGEHISGEAIHRYLTEYARTFDIYDKIRYNTRAIEATRLDDKGSGWIVLAADRNREYRIETKKLIVATGTTTNPLPLQVEGQQNYNAPLYNTAYVSKAADAVFNNFQIKRVTVYGGSKSAYDAVYQSAGHGKQIDWVIRKGGHGPTWMARPTIKLPIGTFQLEHLATSRAMSWMSPCIWGGYDHSSWWTWLLHKMWLGRQVVAAFWKQVSADTLEQSGILEHENMRPLIPDCEMYDIATCLAILNYPSNFYDLVKSGQVRVHREDIDHLDDHSVHLSNGEVLQSDAFITSTGYSFVPALRFTETNIHSELGIPSMHYSADQTAFWDSMDRLADEEIFGRFPSLKYRKQPPKHGNDTQVSSSAAFKTDELHALRELYTPWRLYRNLAPPGLAAKGDRSLAFAGFGISLGGNIRNEIAALWTYAFLNDKLTIDPERDYAAHDGGAEDIYYHTALWSRFNFRRYTYGFGARMPDFVFEATPWNDVLMTDLGLQAQRKGGGFWNWREWFEPHTSSDYRGVTAEWLALQGAKADGQQVKSE